MTIEVTNKIKIYEIEGEDADFPNATIKVLSHWNNDDRVILEIDRKKYTVLAKDLKLAVDNAINIGRF